MLELKNITKEYRTGGEVINALRGVDVTFRKSEFVSILGPSGCGKTTLLNIIGGLDKYTSGDLIINGRSTKSYSDRDWDTYRNHSVGFVFQSYNLIPHQSVLANVELALTLSGVKRSERRKKAREALEKVGLGDQLKKKPAEMSGGQMQRVAIARAIVNDPDIILADEPTGALDTETSTQVMDILKEISRDRLVVMVTHNPDIAEKYSTRIIRILDGVLTSDSAPLSEDEISSEREAYQSASGKKQKKPSMSLFTSFSLSFKNLFSKKKRTILTSFAGSIGIIGIALIYAVSNGTTSYINTVQEQTLSSYPLIIEETTVDASFFLSSVFGNEEVAEEHDHEAVYQKNTVSYIFNVLNSVKDHGNDLESFKKYIEKEREKEDSDLYGAISGIICKYDMDITVYTKDQNGEINVSDTMRLMSDILSEYYGIDMSSGASGSTGSSGNGNGGLQSLMSSSSGLWRELIPGVQGKAVSDVTKEQYDLVYGDWPSDYDDIVLFLDENNEISDLSLYALGFKTADQMEELMSAARDHGTLETDNDSWSYEDICSKDYRIIVPSDCYSYDEETGTYSDLRDTDTGLKYLYDNGITLHVTGIVKPGEDAITSSENGGMGYTHALTEYLINKANDSDIVKAQKEDETTDVLSGLRFRDEDESVESRAEEFREYAASLTDNEKTAFYNLMKSVPDQEDVDEYVSGAMEGMTRADMENSLVQSMTAQTSLAEESVREYVSGLSDSDITDMIKTAISNQYTAQYAAQMKEQLILMTPEQILAAYDAEIEGYTDEKCANLYDRIMAFSDSTYEDNLVAFGCFDLDSPEAIYIYSSTFANKDVIEEAIAEYNDGVEELQKIQYTDYAGLIMSTVTTIINAITYVLIAFVAVSLVVSSIMIGVITLISVQERTKEIGILRAIGASKGNVSSMFNMETFIIGLTSGLIGVLITVILCVPINVILHTLTGIGSLRAFLPVHVAVILVLISVLLTLIAGIIPSRSAAKKDPVVALRTE